MHRRLITALAVTAAAGLGATTALAHTEVKSTYPGSGKTVTTRITTASVTFTEQIRSGTLKVTGPGGKTYSTGKSGRDPRNVKRLRVALKSSKPAGSYTARWTATAADGHHQSGSFKFRLK